MTEKRIHKLWALPMFLNNYSHITIADKKQFSFKKDET